MDGSLDDTQDRIECFRPGVDLPNLMKMASDEMRAPGISIGFGMALQSLSKIAERAMELGDETILEELEHMSIIKRSKAI